jgi:hypothetical protein
VKILFVIVELFTCFANVTKNILTDASICNFYYKRNIYAFILFYIFFPNHQAQPNQALVAKKIIMQ